MNKNNGFSCYIIGDDNITLQCASIILASKHKLLGLVSSSKSIKKWCIANSATYFVSIDDFSKAQKDTTFDYLFSIANGEILTKEILNLPRYYAINYHNSPLPKYAGLYATSWAILNGARQHAITWHIMSEFIDAGKILKQPSFPIDDFDTALSLNLKCYEHALHSFRELIDELATNTVSPVEQNLCSRSYYGLKDKPSNLGFIQWNESAAHIDRQCRALTFGSYTNQLTTPKIIIGGEIFIVKSLNKLNRSSNKKPGTIVNISNQSLEITTRTQNIAINELTDLNGKNCTIQNLVSLFNLDVDAKLDTIEHEFLDKLANSPASNYKIEKFWVNELLKCGEFELSFLSKAKEAEKLSSQTNKITKIPSNLLKKLRLIGENKFPLKDILLTASLIYLYRLNNYHDLSVEFSDQELQSSICGLDKLLSSYIPFSTNFSSNMTFIEGVKFVAKEKEKLFSNKTYFKDISIRYPQLTGIINEIETRITFVDYQELRTYNNDKQLNLIISEKGSWIYFKTKAKSKQYLASHAFIKNMAEHFLTLLTSIGNDPKQKLFELSMIGSKEKNNMMVLWNNTNCKYDCKKTLHQYFEEQVIKTPNSIAASFNGRLIDYKDLNQQANKLAHYLCQQGIKSGQLIGISLERSLEMLICILGILKSGGAYLPLDPNYPTERISYMLNDSQSDLLLMDQESIKRKPNQFQGRIIEISRILQSKNLSDKNPKIDIKPSSLAYVIYTSGTTGKPKGVAISHRAICNHMVWMQKEYTFNTTDIFLQKTPFSFDASVWEFFMPLLVGAKLVIAPKDVHASPGQMVQLIKDHSVSVLQLVPSMLKALVSIDGFDSCKSLKHVFCGGEVLLPKTIDTFFRRNPSETKLHNLYGPTEATIDAITLTCTPKDGKSTVSRIGKPIMNTKNYVLDNEMQIVPIGISGELYISGDGLACGYLNNPEMTKQKFIANPFSNKKNDRLYKTGDLVKWHSDGNIEYLGRRDSQVKIRGFRIEINEIEAYLEKIPTIRQCLVIPDRNPDGSMSLSAYLVLEKNSQLSAKDIRLSLKKSIPEYMIPNRFFVVDKLLATPSGKVDRNVLPTSCISLCSTKESVVPDNDIEKALKEIWSSVLKIEDLGTNDDFFELGGNSLSGMSIISLIQARFSVNLSIRKLFDFPTIYTLAKEIENEMDEITDGLGYSNIVTLQAGGTKTPLYLVHPVGGSIFWYKSLGKYFDKDRPLYGIQDPGIDKNEILFNTIEEMATAYIDSLQAIQTNGPYLLGGASFGSTVAIEMAKQLQEKGEEVSSLISLDGWAFYPLLQNDEAFFQGIMKEQNSRILKKYLENNICNSDFLLELQWHREKMLTQYKLPDIKAKLILFKAKELSELFTYDAPLNWWENYSTQPIERHLIPGDHESMFSEPNIKVLACKLNESLDQQASEPCRENIVREEGEVNFLL
jgi:amino acid adenylation domain-containing protein